MHSGVSNKTSVLLISKIIQGVGEIINDLKFADEQEPERKIKRLGKIFEIWGLLSKTDDKRNSVLKNTWQEVSGHLRNQNHHRHSTATKRSREHGRGLRCQAEGRWTVHSDLHQC